MQGYEVKFNVYAETQEEADATSQAVKTFITEMARRGVAVTATKLTSAVGKWGNNVFVVNYFK